MLTYTCRMLVEIIGGLLSRRATAALRTTSSKTVPHTSPPPAEFRLWPLDMDVYMHMNNACYLRVAELARWRQLGQAGMLGPSIKHGWMFLIAEQTVQYIRPILPLQRFNVRSEILVTEDKWLHYNHYFEAPKGDKGLAPEQYAHIELKAVVKRTSGKTVKVSELLEQCPDASLWMAPSRNSSCGGSSG